MSGVGGRALSTGGLSSLVVPLGLPSLVLLILLHYCHLLLYTHLGLAQISGFLLLNHVVWDNQMVAPCLCGMGP
jgi:hypothetical protein